VSDQPNPHITHIRVWAERLANERLASLTGNEPDMVAQVPGPAKGLKRFWCLLAGHRWDERGDLLAHCQRCGEWGIRRKA
jgi:hypothetical protein